MAPPPPPPELIDDAVAEILLRLPPDDPACLVRASLVCKRWRRILSDSTFPGRYREFHRTPPVLGFLCGFYGTGDEMSHASRRFVPITTRAPFLQPAFGCRALDCRHGRVLFDAVGRSTRTRGSLAVWDPVTGDDKVLSDPDPDSYSYSGAVLCAASGCDHRGCHDGPFAVVFVSSPHEGNQACAWMYSSVSTQADAWSWSAPASVEVPDGSFVERKRAAIVGDQIYFLLDKGAGILKYDLGRQWLTIVDSPGKYIKPDLMTMEDGSLGFVGVKDPMTIHLWTSKVNPIGSMGWVQDRVILVNNLVPAIRTEYTYDQVNVFGFAEGVDILLLGEDASGFVFDLKSGQFRKLSNPEHQYYDVFPYMSFYIPALDRLGQGVQRRRGHWELNIHCLPLCLPEQFSFDST